MCFFCCHAGCPSKCEICGQKEVKDLDDASGDDNNCDEDDSDEDDSDEHDSSSEDDSNNGGGRGRRLRGRRRSDHESGDSESRDGPRKRSIRDVQENNDDDNGVKSHLGRGRGCRRGGGGDY